MSRRMARASIVVVLTLAGPLALVLAAGASNRFVRPAPVTCKHARGNLDRIVVPEPRVKALPDRGEQYAGSNAYLERLTKGRGWVVVGRRVDKNLTRVEHDRFVPLRKPPRKVFDRDFAPGRYRVRITVSWLRARLDRTARAGLVLKRYLHEPASAARSRRACVAPAPVVSQSASTSPSPAQPSPSPSAPSPSPSPSATQVPATITGATESVQGDFTGDGRADVAFFRESTFGLVELWLLVSTGIGFEEPRKMLTLDAGWNWESITAVTVNPNGDARNDIAVFHKRGDSAGGGFGLYLFEATAVGFNQPRFLTKKTAADGWTWASIKAVQVDYNGDGLKDIAVLHRLADGGFNLWIFDATATTFTPRFLSRYAGTSGWSWEDAKPTFGRFTPDTKWDLVVLQPNLETLGVAVWLLTSTGTGFTPGKVAELPEADGWRSQDVKIVAGRFDADADTDLLLQRGRADGGVDLALMHSIGAAFGPPRPVLTSGAASQWEWARTQSVTGDYDEDGLTDVAVLHQTPAGGADVWLAASSGNGFAEPRRVLVLMREAGWEWNGIRLV
ncbi:MAG: hypothetical protein M3323_09780 [Actinomycetota bacterium]|nr:hypothetical protein [Actinomycetota bacterium]